MLSPPYNDSDFGESSRLSGVLSGLEPPLNFCLLPIINDNFLSLYFFFPGNSGQMMKALGLGAAAVVCGSMFAGTEEALGEYFYHNGLRVKAFRGRGCLYFIYLCWKSKWGNMIWGLRTIFSMVLFNNTNT